MTNKNSEQKEYGFVIDFELMKEWGIKNTSHYAVFDVLCNLYCNGQPARYLSSSTEKCFCTPSVKRLAEQTSFSVSTVKRATQWLEAKGFIKKKRRFNNSNLYTFGKYEIYKGYSRSYFEQWAYIKEDNKNERRKGKYIFVDSPSMLAEHDLTITDYRVKRVIESINDYIPPSGEKDLNYRPTPAKVFERLQEGTKVSKSAVKNSIGKLREKGLIQILPSKPKEQRTVLSCTEDSFEPSEGAVLSCTEGRNELLRYSYNIFIKDNIKDIGKRASPVVPKSINNLDNKEIQIPRLPNTIEKAAAPPKTIDEAVDRLVELFSGSRN